MAVLAFMTFLLASGGAACADQPSCGASLNMADDQGPSPGRVADRDKAHSRPRIDRGLQRSPPEDHRIRSRLRRTTHDASLCSLRFGAVPLETHLTTLTPFSPGLSLCASNAGGERRRAQASQLSARPPCSTARCFAHTQASPCPTLGALSLATRSICTRLPTFGDTRRSLQDLIGPQQHRSRNGHPSPWRSSG